MEETVKIYDPNYISACYFRSTTDANHKKVILQITERCNMFCKHCFVSSSSNGNDISYFDIREKILPKLLKAKVSKITLTGGEPLVHPEINKIIDLFAQNDICVAICTNGLLIDQNLIELCYNTKKVHFNISLDGFRNESYGRFRGVASSTFKRIINNISNVAKKGLLNGILVTPNIYAQLQEYAEICNFAKNVGAKYVLFNPLSEFGRGKETKTIGYHNDDLTTIKRITHEYIDNNFEIVYIRFPDVNKKIGECPIGRVLYVFTDGSIAICPYIVFASYNIDSVYKPEQFYISNIFQENCDIDQDLENYALPSTNLVNLKCSNYEGCSKGCLAAKVANGLSIGDCDLEMCHWKS